MNGSESKPVEVVGNAAASTKLRLQGQSLCAARVLRCRAIQVVVRVKTCGAQQQQLRGKDMTGSGYLPAKIRSSTRVVVLTLLLREVNKNC